MIPREPTRTIKRAVLESVQVEVDKLDPNAFTGELVALDLDTGRRHTVGLCRTRHLPETHALLAELNECVHPRVPGKVPPPEVVLEVAIELDLSLRLVGFRRRGGGLAPPRPDGRPLSPDVVVTGGGGDNGE